jgi:hypothetical protein
MTLPNDHGQMLIGDDDNVDISRNSSHCHRRRSTFGSDFWSTIVDLGRFDE